jgi:hypothetical protein
MMEAFPHGRYLPIRQFAGVAMRKSRLHLSTLLRLPLKDATSYFKRRVRNVFPQSPRPRHAYPVSEPGVERESTSQDPEDDLRSRPRFVRHLLRDLDWLAIARYRPRFYSGKIKFIRAKEILHLPDDPAAIWANLAGSFEVESVPGDHLGILNTHAQELAAVISRYVREALCE